MSETCQEIQVKRTMKEKNAGPKEKQECSSCAVTSQMDDNMKRMMSFVEPLGHSQVVDRQSLASLPVGFVKVGFT